jgi:two-component system NtrC family sensor kinase
MKPEADQTGGLVLKVAAPVLDKDLRLTGIVYGGRLLNNSTELVDKIKNVLYRGEKYRGRDVGTTTVFLDDYRIATNVLLPDGSRAIGTRASKEVYQQVMGRGNRWIGRALVVDNWCIAAYEPLRNIGGKPVGMIYVGMLEAPFVQIRNQVVLIFLGIALATVSSLWLLANVTADRITRPLRELVRGTTQVASGDLSSRVSATSEDELGQLAKSFNRMTDELRKATDGYQELTRTLEQKVADRTAELQAAQTQLIQNEKLSSLGKMAAGIAHEINNPLTSILLNSHLMAEKLRKDSRLRENLQLIIDETTRCGAIVKGLLEFSRQSISDKKPADINRVLKTTLQLMESQLMLQKVQTTTALDPGMPEISADANKLKQVFTNLILNAADAMPGGGAIAISTAVDREARQVIITFKDRGGGIPPEIQGKIFDPFFSTKGTKGTGLGLAISYGIIQQHGGTIEAQSSEGLGTTMTVRLPIDETEHKEQPDG